jgi:hypothetical protein
MEEAVPHKRKLYGVKLNGRSKVTNGTRLLPNIDGRSQIGRRFRDLVAAFSLDLAPANYASLSEGQRALIRRAAALSVECERMEVRFALNDGASDKELNVFQRSVNSLRRVIETLGTHHGRMLKTVTRTPSVDEYLDLTGEAAE